MQTLHISRQELHTRGGVLDGVLDSLFDTAILVDTDCRILSHQRQLLPRPVPAGSGGGAAYLSAGPALPLRGGVAHRPTPGPDSFWSSMAGPVSPACFPSWTGSGSSAWWAVRGRNLGRLKKVLSQLSDQAAGFRGLYRIWPGWTAATAWRIF